MTWGVSREAREVYQEETDGMRRNEKRRLANTPVCAGELTLLVTTLFAVQVDPGVASPVGWTRDGVAGTG